MKHLFLISMILMSCSARKAKTVQAPVPADTIRVGTMKVRAYKPYAEKTKVIPMNTKQRLD